MVEEEEPEEDDDEDSRLFAFLLPTEPARLPKTEEEEEPVCGWVCDDGEPGGGKWEACGWGKRGQGRGRTTPYLSA